MMVARGVFKETTKQRRQPMEAEALPPGGARPAGGPRNAPLSDADKQFIRDAMNVYLKPYALG
jgi:hypothetical protein